MQPTKQPLSSKNGNKSGALQRRINRLRECKTILQNARHEYNQRFVTQ